MREEAVNTRIFIEKQVDEIKKTVGSGKAISALSGGVDSSACTVLAHRALGSQLKVLFIDDGLMRQDEPAEVRRIFKKLGIDVEIINTSDEFFDALKGKIDPEEKRKAFRYTFYRCFGREVLRSRARYLVQGTIAADIIETKGGVKTQHNILEQIGIDPEKGFGFKVIEPLKDLFKPEVREVARELGLPESIYLRMPFPGPALATRIIGEVTPERVALVRKATVIVEQEICSTSALPVLCRSNERYGNRDRRRQAEVRPHHHHPLGGEPGRHDGRAHARALGRSGEDGPEDRERDSRGHPGGLRIDAQAAGDH